MPEVLKTLGQSAPLATTNTDLYTVPASTSTVGSCLNVCNRAATTGTFRIAVRTGGAAIENKHYIAYDSELNGNAFVPVQIGMTLATTDVVTVYASSANFSFNLFGSEVS